MLWGALVVLLVILAVYVSVGRLVAANLSFYREAILQELNVRLPFSVEAQTVSGSWNSFSPYIVLRDLRLTFPGNTTPPVALSEGRIGVHVLNSLRTGSLQVTRVELSHLQLRGELGPEGGFQLQGFGSTSGEGGTWLQDFLLNVESIELLNNRLALTLPGGEVRDLSLNLLLARDGSYRRMDAQLASTAGSQFTVLAEGIGDPFRPGQFVGDAYLNAESTDLGAIRQLLGWAGPAIQIEGAGEVQVWLQWDRGEPLIELHLDARDINVTAMDGSWALPLDRFAAQGQLEDSRRHRRIYAADLVLEKGGVALELPAMQLDGDDNTLRLLARDIPMASAAGLFAQMEAAPENLRDVFTALAPAGQVDLLELRLDDVSEPAKGWEASASFSEISVEPYVGAPGVTSARGYARFTQDGGEVIVDGESVALSFPKIYEKPLSYEEIYGTLTLDWDEQALKIGSGLLTVRAQEGEAKLLFGLQIPFEPTPEGLEMDLLVGLQNFHPDLRHKYLPYTLPEGLLDWLEGSIGDGHVNEGAFLWRGSLTPGAPLKRTVQLGFNASDTLVNYDDRWPPATLGEGIVLIDDVDVSVWAHSASLLDSSAQNVSLESVVNASKQAVLGLRGSLSGPAKDGLRILNETPLTDLMGGAFDRWSADGELEAQLSLQLVLASKPPPPVVDVEATLRDVDLEIVPGNLPLSAVNGEFGYSTRTGFSSTDLKGKLWGETITASVSQHHGPGSNQYVAGTSQVWVNFDGRAEMSTLRDWLKLDFLRLAQGAANVDGSIRLLPGQAPALHLGSDLVGVSLDLPQPWDKPPDASRPLSYVMPLSAGGDPLALQLGSDLKLTLLIQDGGLHGGALGVNVEPLEIEAGQLLVTGQAPLIDADQWMAFATEYFFPPGDAANGAASDGVDSLSTAAPRVNIRQFSAGLVHVSEQSVHDINFSLDFKSHRWELELETDWLRGNGYLSRDGTASVIAAQYLDISKLAELMSLSDEAAAEVVQDGAVNEVMVGKEPVPDIPVVHIDIENLHREQQRLGELSFNLQAQDGLLTAQGISWSLAEIKFDDTQQNMLTWRQGEQPRTDFSSHMQLQDIGATMGFFGYERIIEAQAGTLAINLSWPDAPAQFSLAQGEGSVQIHLGKGNFHQAPASASGALRVVSILNLADIVRRLSLTQMFESGIPFDSVDGQINLSDGVIAVPNLNVAGGSSFLFKGRSNIEQRSLQGELVATLPVASNLPWIAALTASLPIAAGVFVISKIFDKQMSRLSSLVYSIGGSWDEPQIEFSRVFDNNASDGAATDAVVVPPIESEEVATGDDSQATEISPDVSAGSASAVEELPASLESVVPGGAGDTEPVAP